MEPTGFAETWIAISNKRNSWKPVASPESKWIIHRSAGRNLLLELNSPSPKNKWKRKIPLKVRWMPSINVLNLSRIAGNAMNAMQSISSVRFFFACNVNVWCKFIGKFFGLINNSAQKKKNGLSRHNILLFWKVFRQNSKCCAPIHCAGTVYTVHLHS